jgi:hypothetical protein
LSLSIAESQEQSSATISDIWIGTIETQTVPGLYDKLGYINKPILNQKNLFGFSYSRLNTFMTGYKKFCGIDQPEKIAPTKVL